jgi:hypothetical protein
VEQILKTTTLKQNYLSEVETQLKPDDVCTVEVPYEMSCNGFINSSLDGSNCTIISIFNEEASVFLDHSTETFTLPLFCLKKGNLALKKKVALNRLLASSPVKSSSVTKPKEYINDKYSSSCQF